MSASLNNAGLELLKDEPALVPAAGLGTPSPTDSMGHEALQALLAFAALHEQVRTRRAQELRDAPVGGSILEAIKSGGVFTRFDRRTGAFGAYNADRTIRTFFIPNDGERYFRRQAKRPD